MSVLEITLQYKRSGIYPITVELRQPGLLSLRRESEFALSAEILAKLARQDTEPRAYGETLGQLLLQGAVRDLYIKARSETTAELQLLLVVEAKELRPLRWERLALPDDGGWTAAALAQGIAFSRYLPSLSDRRFALIGRLDLQLLAAIASPPEDNLFALAPFDADAVSEGLRTSLGDLPHQILPAATLDSLTEQLADGEYTLLHIVAHGAFNARTGETALYFLGGQHGVEAVPAERLINRLKALKRLPHLIFLSTCESAKAEAEGDNALGGLAHRLVKQLGIPAVVAMGDKVSVSTANALAEGFYRHLRQHGQPDRALTEAAGPLAERGDILLPALYSRLGGRPLFSDSAERPLTRKEIQYGLAQLADLLPQRAPILLPDYAKLERRFAALPHSENLGRSEREEQAEILQELNSLSEECLGLDFAGLARGDTPGAYTADCPFPGLYAFTENERQYYFGREQLSETLLKRLSAHPFLAVLGMSGSGKSSLVMAGILPLLQQHTPTLQKHYFKPGNRPLASLETALGARGEAPYALIIDQFEELFTLCSDPTQQHTFIERIMGLEMRRGDCLLLTLRSDFIGECAPFPALKTALQNHIELVAPMRSAELRSAMEQQAQQTGLRFEADLSHTILAEVDNEPGAMPLLQHLLQELWKRRHGRWLKTAEYHALGGIKQAIAHTADGFYLRLEPQEQEHCRNIFIRLTRLGEGESDEQRDTRRRVSLDELVPAGADAAQIKALAARLADTRLLMSSAEHIEVAHEALIQHWQRLRDWLNEDRLALSILADVRRQAQDWDAEERRNGLLPRWNAKLEQAEELVKNPRFGATALELAFLQACRDLKEREEHEEREKQRKLKQRFRWAVAVSVLAVVASVFAWLGYQKAEEKTTQALQAQQQAEQKQQLAERESRRAEREKQRAEQEKQRAEEQTRLVEQKNQEVEKEQRQALLNQSRFLADQARQANVQRQTSRAMRIALEALPESTETHPERPYLQQAAQVLYNSVLQHWRGGLDHEDEVRGVTYNPDGSRLLSWTREYAYVWDARSLRPLHRLGGHQHAIQFGAFSPDSRLLLTADSPSGADANTGNLRASVRVWDAVSGELLHSVSEYNYGVSHAVFSPDSRLLALTTGYPKNSAGLWEARSSVLRHTLSGHQDWVEQAAFSPDGRLLATASKDKTVRLWEVESGALQQTFSEPQAMHRVAFSVDGKWLAAASEAAGSFVKLWDVDSKQLKHRLGPQTYGTEQLLFSPDRQHLATADGETVRIWKLADGELSQTLRKDNTLVNRAAFAPDGKTLAVAYMDNVASLWDVQSGNWLLDFEPDCTRRVSDNEPCVFREIAFSPANEQIATVIGMNPLQLWNAYSGEPLHIFRASGTATSGWNPALDGLWEQFMDTRFSPDGRLIASIAADANIWVWDVERAKKLYVLATPPNEAEGYSFTSLAFSPDAALLLTLEGNTAKLWEADSGQPHKTLQGHEGALNYAVFSPDGAQILTAAADNSARLWDARSGDLQRTLGGHDGEVSYAAFSAQGARLLTVAADAKVRIWERASGKLLHTLEHKGESDAQDIGVMDAVFSPDGNWIASSASDRSVRLWDAESGALRHVLRGHCDNDIGRLLVAGCEVLSIAFSPDSASLVTTSDDFDARVWDTASGALRYLIDGHCEATRKTTPEPWNPWGCPLYHAAFSADGALLATASGDHSARLWDAASGALLYTLDGHDDSVIRALFAPDGKHLLTVSTDNSLRLWPIFSHREELIERARHALMARPDGTPAERLSCEEREKLFLNPVPRCE